LRTSKNPANDAINAGKENHPSIASVLGGCTNIPFMPSGGKKGGHSNGFGEHDESDLKWTLPAQWMMGTGGKVT
jgi:hypothetical protein